jgi:hypothetical protein
MDASMDHDPQAFCTVTQMAKQLGLSRPRFYELVAAGVFPPPAYSLLTRMPLYPLTLQEVCLKVRRTGIAFNGQTVRFYERRKAKRAAPEHKETATILRKMGLQVTIAEVSTALRKLKLTTRGESLTESQVICSLYQYFRTAQP